MAVVCVRRLDDESDASSKKMSNNLVFIVYILLFIIRELTYEQR